jgi:accessory gene regulator B
MFRIERISKKIADTLANNLDLDNDNREVLAYGAFALLQILLSIILVAVFGLIFNVIIEALIITFTISIFRKYSGGVHASTSDSCVIIGTIISVGLAVLFSRLSSGPYLHGVLVFGLATFAWAYYVVYKLAPVASPAKPIKNKEKRKRMKKGSILTLSVYMALAASLVGFFYSGGGSRLLSYSYCIYGGVLWQTFTLTNVGHLIMGRIDDFFNQILILRRDGKQNEKAN